MLSRLRSQAGNAGLVVAIVALVAALAGGAIAANGGSNDGQATASAKGKQGPRGPKGAKGAKGDPGPAGPAGPAGPKGDTGAAGSNGTDGTDGKNGTTGPTGPTGAPWPAGGTLPKGATETGSWGGGEAEPEGTKRFQVSFPIPLEEELPLGQAVVVKSTEASKPGCPGRGVAGVPMADQGFLCVYVNQEQNASSVFFVEPVFNEVFDEWEEVTVAPVAPTGGRIRASCAANCFVGGTWAVTAN